MALIDFEAAWLALAEAISDRQGIGRDQLLALMKKLEVEYKLEEGLAERMFRHYGVALSEDLRAAARGDEQVGHAAATEAGQVPRLGTQSVPGNGNAMIDQGEHDGNRNTAGTSAHRGLSAAVA